MKLLKQNYTCCKNNIHLVIFCKCFEIRIVLVNVVVHAKCHHPKTAANSVACLQVVSIADDR